MQEIISHFTSVMSWLTLGLAGVAVVLLGLEGLHLHQDRRRAMLGLIAMVLVLGASAASLFGLATRQAPHGFFLSALVLPLAAPVLLFALYQLSFPPLPALSAAYRSRTKRVLLLVLCAGGVLSTGGLVLLDFLSS